MPTIAEDQAAIIAGTDLGQVAAVFTIAGPGTVSTRGWFTDATEQINIMTGQVEAVNATFSCLATAISTVKTRNTVVINARTYTVERIEQIGNGWTLVHLKT